MGLASRGEPSIRADADDLYDSAAVAHDRRWDLPLPDRDDTLRYMARVLERVIERCREPDREDMYFVPLAAFHEDMHGEAFTYTRQTLGYPPPRLSIATDRIPPSHESPGALPGDVSIPGGTFALGALQSDPFFVFDNEKWSHPVTIRPFDIARAAVTQEQFAAFVDDDGYRRQEFWDDEGWRLARGNGRLSPRLLAASVQQRLGTSGFRSLGTNRAAPACAARVLVRGRCLLPVGRSPITQRSRVGSRSDDPTRSRRPGPILTQDTVPVG